MRHDETCEKHGLHSGTAVGVVCSFMFLCSSKAETAANKMFCRYATMMEIR